MKLTLPQRDIYFEQLLYPNEPIYNIGAKIEIVGALDRRSLQAAYIHLIDQHDAYRSVIIPAGDEATVKIHDQHTCRLGFADFSAEVDPSESAERYMKKQFSLPFDLLAEQLLHKFTLLKVARKYHYLFSVYHHIITDGWGTSLMFQRLVQNYNEIIEHGKVVSEYPFKYQDFEKDDQAYQKSEDYIADKNYWIDKFKVLPDNVLEITHDAITGNRSDRKKLVISRERYNALTALAAKYEANVFHMILATLFIYFGRKHQKDDWAIGLPVLNRGRSAFKKTVGLFMGMSPLRMKLHFQATFGDLLRAIRNQLRKDYRHQRFPLGKLVQEVRAHTEKHKIFNITLSYEKQDYSIDFHGTATKVIPLTHQSERVALALYVREFDASQDVEVDFDYNLKYFNEHTITSVLKHFDNLLDEVLTNPDQVLHELNYLDRAEREQLLSGFTATAIPYPSDDTVVSLFKAQVTRTPEAVALRDDHRTYSYEQLDALSVAIAGQLTTLYENSAHGAPVALMVSRSADMVALLLGILTSGRAYLPLDPSFPAARLNYIIADSGAKILVSEAKYISNVSADMSHIVLLEELLSKPVTRNADQLPKVLHSETAYVIYTSGTTGNPKGVEVGHRSLCNFLWSMQSKPGISQEDLLFSVTTYSFDISILEFFLPLISGASVFIASQEVLSDPRLILKQLAWTRPSIIQATPGFYQMLFNAGWQGDSDLRVFCGGDILASELADKLVRSTQQVWNMYGPTETTIWSSVREVRHGLDSSNIGSPINNTEIYILDDYHNLQPIGVSGNLYISGAGLAKGYYQRPDLTARKFIPNPFKAGSLMYDTGDLGYWQADGTISFLGRKDNQVKIRGYRIELTEIENQLNRMDGIANAVVVATKGNAQDAILVAYVLLTDSVLPISEQTIILKLQNHLPNYMLPARVVILDEFPFTPNLKIDREFLAQKKIKLERGERFSPAPVSGLERKLLQYWKEILAPHDEIGIHDNFFALGGHSLNAVMLVKFVEQNLQINITIKTVFDYPTVHLLANNLENSISNKTTIWMAETKDVYKLTNPQYNIWLATRQKHLSSAYNMPAAYHIEGNIDLKRVKNALNSIIEKYEILRTNFVEINGNVYQKIKAFDKDRLKIPVVYLDQSEPEEKIHELINQAFNLEHDLLVRMCVIRTGHNKEVLLFLTHHVIMDGISLESLISEFIENYRCTSVRTRAVKFQFKDYSEWANQIFAEHERENAFFWEKYLRHYSHDDFLTIGARPGNKPRGAEKVLFELSAAEVSKLKQAAAKEQVTFFTLLVAAFNVTLHKLSGQDDFCIGTVHAGNDVLATELRIGMFVKTLILRTRIDLQQSFAGMLKDVQSDLLQIDQHQDIDFSKLPQTVSNILFVYQNPDFNLSGVIDLGEAKLISMPVQLTSVKLPLVINVFERDGVLSGSIEFDCDKVDAGLMRLLALKYCMVLVETGRTVKIKVADIDCRLEEEITTSPDLDIEFNF